MKDPTSAYIQGSIVGAIIGLIVGIIIGREAFLSSDDPQPPTATDTLYIREPALVRDTITHYIPVRAPIFSDTAMTATALTAEGDSATVLLPVMRREYTDTATYRAIIEGYEPRLLSLDIYPRPAPKAKRWHLGPAIGVGYDGQGIRPFIGATLTFSICSF